MPDPKTMTYLCFAGWAIGTALVFILQVFRPIAIQGKIQWDNPRHTLMRVTFYIWLTMWCFRSMY
jgi:hypothetical protein